MPRVPTRVSSSERKEQGSPEPCDESNSVPELAQGLHAYIAGTAGTAGPGSWAGKPRNTEDPTGSDYVQRAPGAL